MGSGPTLRRAARAWCARRRPSFPRWTTSRPHFVRDGIVAPQEANKFFFLFHSRLCHIRQPSNERVLMALMDNGRNLMQPLVSSISVEGCAF